jgi:hypothetical protein
MGGTYSTDAEMRNAYKMLAGKSKRNVTLGRTRCRPKWVYNIKMDLKV